MVQQVVKISGEDRNMPRKKYDRKTLDMLRVPKSRKSYIKKKTTTNFANADVCTERFLNAFVRDVVLTRNVWERTQKSSNFETASNSF